MVEAKKTRGLVSTTQRSRTLSMLSGTVEGFELMMGIVPLQFIQKSGPAQKRRGANQQ